MSWMSRHAGIPDAASVQEVLLWQTATISTMYRIVAKALKLKVRPRTAFLGSQGQDVRPWPQDQAI